VEQPRNEQLPATWPGAPADLSAERESMKEVMPSHGDVFTNPYYGDTNYLYLTQYWQSPGESHPAVKHAIS
jgi:hypothetical protein